MERKFNLQEEFNGDAGCEAQFSPMQEKKNVICPNLYDLDACKESENFGSFISKAFSENTFSSIFSIKSAEDFFGSVPDFYNPLREVAQKFETFSDSIEIPAVSKVYSGINNESAESSVVASAGSMIRMYPFYAKKEWSLNFLSKVAANENYFKSVLGMYVSAVERNLFVNGKGNSYDNPEGILNNAAIAGAKKTLNVTATTMNQLADKLLSLTMQLPTEYRNNSCFMMSAALYAQICVIKDTAGRYIFDNNTLFGYKVYVLDELDASRDDSADAPYNVLFGNFKHGYVVCDQAKPDIQIHKLYSNPGSVGVVYSARCGAGVTNANAIQLAEITLA